MPADDPRRTEDRNDLPSVSVRRPILAIVMNLLIVIAGIAALQGVEVRELPSVEQPIVTVRADYPGATPATMDSEVTRRLEGAAARVPGVQQINSASEEGNARMRLYFDPSVDINVAANDVREAVAEVQRQLPDGVENLVVVKANDESDPIVRLSAWSDSLDEQQLTTLIEDRVVTELLSVPGVADVQLYGDRNRTLTILVDPHRLASYGLSIADVSDALETANLDIPAGSMKSDEQNLIVRADASVTRPDLVERIVVSGTTRIGDVASVFYGPEEATSYVRLDGRQVIAMGIVRQAQSNTIEISSGIDRAIEELNRQLRDVVIVKTSDDAVFIRGAVREVLVTLVLGIAIVIGVILVFIGSPRITLVPSVTIPIALIGTVAAIWLFGFSINILTLLALVLATGLVVDDAIVVMENIERTRRQGAGPLAAAVLGTRQVFFAVIATTVTLASVFLPIAFLPGRSGPLFTEFGFVLAIAVSLSSFVALSLCPMMMSRLTSGTGTAERPPKAFRRSIVSAGRALTDGYGRLLGAALRAPVLVCGLGLMLACGVALLYQSLDRELVPREDRGLLIVSVQGPDGVNLDYTERQALKVESILQPLVESGEATGLFSLVGRWDLHRAFIIAPLAPWGERRPQDVIAAELEPQLREIPGARVSIRTPNSLSIRTGGNDLEFAVTGPEYTGIARVSEALIETLQARDARFLSPRMQYSTTQPQLSIEIDRERASNLGVDIDAISATLRAMVDGSEVAELNVEDETVPIRIESRTGTINDTDDLRNLYVAGNEGRLIPLSSLITVAESATATELEREAQRRAIEVEAGLAEGFALNDAVAALEQAAAETLPQGYDLILLGQADALDEAESGIIITFAIALLVVFLVLAAQFESFASAFVVIVTVPFGLAAAIFALWMTGNSLNIYSQIGLIMLVGLMAKNGILIVEFADQLRDQGRTPAEAAHEAAMVRLRPVAMTVLSTTLAGLPLILGSGAGAEARESIGWVIFGGLGIAILAILFVTPVSYRLIAPLARPRGQFSHDLDREMSSATSAHDPSAGDD